MNKLTQNELQNVNGGGYKVALAIVGVAIFAFGVLDGYTRPNKCKK